MLAAEGGGKFESTCGVLTVVFEYSGQVAGAMQHPPTAQAGTVEEFADARRTDAGIALNLVEGFSGGDDHAFRDHRTGLTAVVAC